MDLDTDGNIGIRSSHLAELRKQRGKFEEARTAKPCGFYKDPFSLWLNANLFICREKPYSVLFSIPAAVERSC